MKAGVHIKSACVVLFTLICTGRIMAQSCSSSTPHFTIDMTGSVDSVWTKDTVRDGQCCGTSNPDRCIHFTITLDKLAQGIRVEVTGGTGTTYYTVSCSTSTLVGDTICVSGVGPHEVVICKPGGNVQTYTITSIPKPQLVSDTVSINQSCQGILSTLGLDESTITWASLGNNSTYNSYLNCLSGCDSTIVTLPSSGFPAYVDYVVSGYNIRLACDTTRFYDTVRVFMYNNPLVSILPSPAYVCAGTNTTTVTAQGSGGLPPYSYLWSDSSTAASKAFAAGTYWVRITDSLGCNYAYDTVTITTAAKPAVAITGQDSLCQNTAYTYSTAASAGTTCQWTCSTATFTGAATLDSAILSFSQYGTHTILLTTTDTLTGCDSTTTMQVFVDSLPVSSITGITPVCAESTGVAYSATPNASYNYSWAVSGGTLVSGNGTSTITVDWPTAGNHSVQATVTKSPVGCTQNATYNVTVTPLPVTGPINHH